MIKVTQAFGSGSFSGGVSTRPDLVKQQIRPFEPTTAKAVRSAVRKQEGES
jgi:hypothetical protein